MFTWLIRIFQGNYRRPHGILLYGTVQEVIQVFALLEKESFSVRLVAPPPEFRVGCDLAIEFELLEQEAIENLVKSTGKTPQRVVSTKEMLPDVLKRSQVIEIDDCIMCKAGNMKITIEKNERRIVNISGGGCPDIPYVAQRLHSLKLQEAPDPISIGNSLCTYMLQIAFDALKKRMF